MFGALALACAFALGYAAPRPGLYALVLGVVLEGAFRKWVLNDVVAFLAKDFLALGIYAAVIPTIRREEWRRPWWLIAPIAGLVFLAVVYTARSDSWGQAVIGLRSWTIYVPLLWVAPKLLATRTRTLGFVVLILTIGVAESILAAVQSLSGSAALNELVPGSPPPIVTVDGLNYLRPSGTMLQVGAFAGLVLFAVLAACALVAAAKWRILVALAAAAPFVLVWSIVYAGGRALFLGVAAATAALVAYLVWRRRFGALAAVVASFALGYAALVTQPFVDRAPGRLQAIEYTIVDEQGRVLKATTQVTTGSPRGGFTDRLTAIEEADPEAEPPAYTSSRIRAQLETIADQGVLGRGTGTMTLGSTYVVPDQPLAGESIYAKAAWELGWPGLLFVLWLFGALVLATAVGAVMTLDWRRAAALVGFGAACLIPAWCLFNFTLDMPAVAILFWSFTGIATAWASPFAIRRT